MFIQWHTKLLSVTQHSVADDLALLIKPHSSLLCLCQRETGRGKTRHAKRGLCVRHAHRDEDYDNG